jgi:hypothetical protein
MSIETVLLIVILTFGFGIMLDRWNMRLSRSRRRHAEWGFTDISIPLARRTR